MRCSNILENFGKEWEGESDWEKVRLSNDNDESLPTSNFLEILMQARERSLLMPEEYLDICYIFGHFNSIIIITLLKFVQNEKLINRSFEEDFDRKFSHKLRNRDELFKITPYPFWRNCRFMTILHTLGGCLESLHRV